MQALQLDYTQACLLALWSYHMLKTCCHSLHSNWLYIVRNSYALYILAKEIKHVAKLMFLFKFCWRNFFLTPFIQKKKMTWLFSIRSFDSEMKIWKIALRFVFFCSVYFEKLLERKICIVFCCCVTLKIINHWAKKKIMKKHLNFSVFFSGQSEDWSTPYTHLSL